VDGSLHNCQGHFYVENLQSGSKFTVTQALIIKETQYLFVLQ